MSERQERIVEHVNNTGFATAADLAERLDVSAITIRREFKALEAAGKLQRVHGGAVPLDRAEHASHMTARVGLHVEEKKLLASYVASIITPRQKIFLDAGSTCFYIAQALPEGLDVVVITHSIDNMNAIRKKRGIRLIGIGGELEEKLDAFVGPIAEHQIAQFRADVAFLSAMSVSVSRGTCDDTMLERAIKNGMNRNAERSYIVVDSSKFSGVSLFNSIAVDDIQRIITPTTTPQEKLRGFRDIGVEVIPVPAVPDQYRDSQVAIGGTTTD